jgi:predicted transcriptional regulator
MVDLFDNPPSGDELRRSRRRLGLSRTRLAAVAGCSPAYVQMLEDGYQPSRGDTYREVVETLERLEAVKDGRP